MMPSQFLIRFLCYGSIPVFVATVAMAFAVALGGMQVRKDEGTQFAVAGGILAAGMLVAAIVVAFFSWLSTH